MFRERFIFLLAFSRLSETGSGVLALAKRDFAQIVFNRIKYICQYSIIQIWKCQFLLEGKSVQFVSTCVAHKWFVYVIAAVERRDDKQRI